MRPHSRSARVLVAAMIFSLLTGQTMPAFANPTGGTVAAGIAAINQSNPVVTNVTQYTDKAIINWTGFSNSVGETIQFNQPSSTAAVLNRVTTFDPSVIQGQIKSNGRVFLLNPNGVVFGASSRVDVGGLLVSTLKMSDDDFMAGNYALVQDPAKALAAVINKGTITAADGGTVALVAPLVNNEGKIVAALGKVAIGGATKAVVSFDGQGLISVALRDGPPKDVVLSEDAASDLLQQAVQQPRIVEAGGVSVRDGKMYLASAEGLAMNEGEIVTDGAPGSKAGQVVLESTQATVLAPGSRISASGVGEDSAGGEIKALSRGTTVFAPEAELEAEGGTSGDGGLIEVSGDQAVTLDGQASTRATNGKAGTFVLDPDDLTIIPGAGNFDSSGYLPKIWFSTGNVVGNDLSVGALEDLSWNNQTIYLQAGNTITVSDLGGNIITLAPNSNLVMQTQTGDITFASTADGIQTQGTGSITIQAGVYPGALANLTLGTVRTVNQPIILDAGTGGGNVTLSSAYAGTSRISIGATNGTIDPNGSLYPCLVANTVDLSAGAGIGNATQPMTLTAANISATNLLGSGSIYLYNDSSLPTTVSSLVAGTAGEISFTQAGTGPVTFGTVFAGSGNISLLASGTGRLQLNGAVTATSGNVVIGANGDIDGGGLVTAGNTITLSASTGIGEIEALNLSCGNITATNLASGDIHINNAFGTAVTVPTLTNQGSIYFRQTGHGNVTFGTVAANGSSVYLSNTGADLTVGAVTATDNVVLETLVGGHITVTGNVVTGNVGIATYTSAGNVVLTGNTSGTGANPNAATSVTAAGAITGAGTITTNLVTLTATNGIGSAVTPVSVLASAITASNTGPNGLYITTANAANFTVNSLTSGDGGSIVFNQTGTGGVAFNSVSSISGNVSLSATGNLIITGSGVQAEGATPVIALSAGGNITGTGVITANEISLTATTGIGTSAVPLNLAASTITATNATSGGVFLNNELGTPVTVSTLTASTNGDIGFTQSGGGSLIINGNVTTVAGNIALTNAVNDILIASGANIAATGGATTLTAAGSINGTTGSRISGTPVSLVAGGGIGAVSPVTLSTLTVGNLTTGNGDLIVTNTVATPADVTVGALTAGGQADIVFTQLFTGIGSGNVAFGGNVTTNGGSITLTRNGGVAGDSLDVGAGATVASAGGAISYTSSRDLALTGTTNAGSGAVTMTAGGNLMATAAGVGTVTANSVSLSAANGIGQVGTPIELATSRVNATNSATNGIVINDTSAGPVTVASLTAYAAGNVTYTQTGGGPVIFGEGAGRVYSATGDISLSNAGTLTIATSVATGGNTTITLQTSGSGDVVLTGTTTAGTSGNVIVSSGGKIEGSGLITAGTANLTAATGIGPVKPVMLTAANISGNVTGSGDIRLFNVGPTDLAVALLNVVGTGEITFGQSGGGNVTFTTVTTNNGTISLTNSGGNLTVGTTVSAGGTKNVAIKTLGDGNIALSGNVSAANATVELVAADSITGGGNITASAVSLSSVNGIGTSATSVALVAGNVSAINTTAGGVWLTNAPTSGNVEVSNLTSGGSGGTTYTQSVGNVTFDSIRTDNGAISLTNTGGSLTIADSVTAGNGGLIAYTTSGGGTDIVLTGTTTTAGTANITSIGSLNGGGRVTAGTVNLTAATGMGNTTPLNLSASTISAVNSTSGETIVNNALATPVTVTSLTAPGFGNGNITFNQTGGGLVSFNVVTAGTGAATLTNTGGDLTVFGAILGNTNVTLQTITSGRVVLTGSTTATTGNVSIDSAGTITGGGLVRAPAVVLAAETGIGDSGTPVSLVTPAISANNASGGDLILTNAATGNVAVAVSSLTAGGVGNIEFTESNASPVTFTTVSTAHGAISLTGNGGSLIVGGAVTAGNGGAVALTTNVAGNITLTGSVATAGSVTLSSVTNIVGAGSLTADSVVLTAVTGIGSSATLLNLRAGKVSASDSTSGGIHLSDIFAAPVTVSSLTAATAGDIEFAQSGGGSISFGTVAANNGTVTLYNADAGLTVGTSVSTGTNNAITLRTLTVGDLTLTGSTNSGTGGSVTIECANGAINGAGLVTAGNVNLDARSGIGNLIPLRLFGATTLSADNAGSGDVALTNTSVTTVDVNSLTTSATSATATGRGSVIYNQIGGGGANIHTVTTRNGNVSITNDGAGITLLGAVTAGGGGISTIRAITTIDGPGLVSADSVILDAVTGIGSTATVNLAAAAIRADNSGSGNIVLSNTLATPVEVSSLTVGGTGNIAFTENGGGTVTFDKVQAGSGNVLLTGTSSEIVVAGPITGGGNIELDTTGALCDLFINGPIKTTGTGRRVTLTSQAAINGSGLITADDVLLGAVAGIGNTTPLRLSTSTLTGANNTGNGSIALSNVAATAVTVTSLTVSGTGDIAFDELGGGTVTFGTVTTANGSVSLSNIGGHLTIGGTLTAAGTLNNVTLRTLTAGNLTLTGSINATGGKVELDSAGSIGGVGTATASTVDANAVNGIGLSLSASTIEATNSSGGNISLTNALASPTTVSSLSVAGTGNISFEQSLGGSALFGPVSTTNGTVTLRNLGGHLQIGGPLTVGGGKTLTLQTVTTGDITLIGSSIIPLGTANLLAAGSIGGDGLVSAATVNLTAATGIGDSTPLNLQARTISAANSGSGNIVLYNSFVRPVNVTKLSVGGVGNIEFYQRGGRGVTFQSVTAASGSVTLSATEGDITLGTIVASGIANVTSETGSIFAGTGVTNLTAATANLVAAYAIGQTGTPLRTSVGTLNAKALDGGVFISQVGGLTIGTIISSGPNGQVEISNTGGDILLGTITAQRHVRLTATTGSIFNVTPGVTNIRADSNAMSVLSAAGVIGTRTAPISVCINPGYLAVSAGGSIDGVSVDIVGVVLPDDSLIVLNTPPGLVLFNQRIPGLPNQVTQRADPSRVFFPWGLGVVGPFDLVWDDQVEPDLDLIVHKDSRLDD